MHVSLFPMGSVTGGQLSSDQRQEGADVTTVTNLLSARCLLLEIVFPSIGPGLYKSVLVGTLLTPFYK